MSFFSRFRRRSTDGPGPADEAVLVIDQHAVDPGCGPRGVLELLAARTRW
ncbi:hypothetical protein [Pseudonocardia sp. DLS-67]